MQLQRNRFRLVGLFGRWVLLWFVLSLGAAVASPIVHPQAVELVCSTAGAVKAVVQTDEGAQELGASHADCPLCLPTGAPPAAEGRAVDLPLPQGRLARAIPARLPAPGAAPLEARGPPAAFFIVS